MSERKQAPATYPWVVNAAATGRWPALQLRQFWSYGELIYFFAVRDLKVRYKQAFLGLAWAGIQPLVGALTFTLLFHRLADVDVGGESYFAFALVGFGIWTYFSSTVQAGTVSLLYNADLLTKVAFPRVVPPTAALLPGVIDLGVALALGTIVALATTGAPSALAVLVGLPLGSVLLLLSVIGPVLFLSATVVKYRDTGTLVTFGLQLLLFASPVAYPPELLAEPWRTLLYLNPLAGALGSFRAALVGTALPSAGQLLLSVVVGIVATYVGLLHFRRSEREFRGHHLMTVAIELDHVGKRYRLGEHHGTGTDLRETLARLSRRFRGRGQPATRDFWSLRDVSFAVEEGTALGVIGANGAGKSTLLKVINNITTPTEGTSRTRGRVGSLLEVGTGFHGELTGLENTYLNGAILGMTKREVRSRLDDIVEFAGLQQFMDTPVKRYSSGMYLRLGFAIAAHMEAEILLVDEVLAVGDADFQRRCLGKMNEVEASGRTVLFVSHNMDAMARLCPTTMWLDKGRIQSIGPTEPVIAQYMQASASGSADAGVQLELDPTAAAHVVGADLVDEDGSSVRTLTTRSTPWMQVDIVVREAVPALDVSFQVTTRGGVGILEEALSDVRTGELSQPGRYRVACRLPAILTPGEYTISIWLGSTYENLEQHENLLAFAVEGDDLGRLRRLITIATDWKTARLDDHVLDG